MKEWLAVDDVDPPLIDRSSSEKNALLRLQGDTENPDHWVNRAADSSSDEIFHYDFITNFLKSFTLKTFENLSALADFAGKRITDALVVTNNPDFWATLYNVINRMHTIWLNVISDQIRYVWLT